MAVELCPSSRLTELLGDRLLYGSTTVRLDRTTFGRGALIGLYFVPLGDDRGAQTDDRRLRDLYGTANETEKTLEIVQVSYPDTTDDRKRFDESTSDVPWHSVIYENAEKRVSNKKDTSL